MLRLGCLLFVVSLAWLAASQPIASEEGGARVARRALPGRMMLVGNYAMHQPRGRSYEHQGLVAAGTVAAGPYYGGRRSQQVNQGEEEEERPVEDEPQEDDASEEEEERKPKVARVAPQQPRGPAPAASDDDDEEDAAPARRRGSKNQSSQATYSNFFPIVFGSTSGGSRRRNSGGNDEDEGVSGGSNPGLTAISNSFSTGRGAVASSNANAYGGRAPAVDTAPTQYRLSSPSRYRS